MASGTFLVPVGSTLTVQGWLRLGVLAATDREVRLAVRPLPNPPCWKCRHAAWFPPRLLIVPDGPSPVPSLHRTQAVRLRRRQFFVADRWIRVDLLAASAAGAHLGVKLRAWARCQWCASPLHWTRVTVAEGPGAPVKGGRPCSS